MILRCAELGAIQTQAGIGVLWAKPQRLRVFDDGEVVVLAELSGLSAVERAGCGAPGCYKSKAETHQQQRSRDAATNSFRVGQVR